MSIVLTTDEQKLADELQALIPQLAVDPGHDAQKIDAYNLQLAEAGKKGQDLHELLAAHGQEPRHTRSMLENRGMKPTDPGFYANLHSAQDLLAFISG